MHSPLRPLAVCATLVLFLAGCGDGATRTGGEAGSGGAGESDVRLSIAPAGGRVDTRPERGITIKAAGGRITHVVARAGPSASPAG